MREPRLVLVIRQEQRVDAILIRHQRTVPPVPIIEITNQMNAFLPGRPKRKRDDAIAPVTRAELVLVEELAGSGRGAGGFGSTGKH